MNSGSKVLLLGASGSPDYDPVGSGDAALTELWQVSILLGDILKLILKGISSLVSTILAAGIILNRYMGHAV